MTTETVLTQETAGGRAALQRKKAPKRTIETAVHVHDRTQLETVFDYYLRRGQSAADKRQDAATLRYQVDAYLFYPRQFALNEHTYPKERFFADVRPLLRFREPKFSYKSMLGTKGGSKSVASGGTAASPLVYLSQYVAGLEQRLPTEPVQNAVDEVRLFACAYISAFLRGIDRNKRRLARLNAAEPTANPEDWQKLCTRLRRQVERAHTVILAFRQLIDRVGALPDAEVAPLGAELKLVDEYCYYRLRDGVAFLLTMVADMSTAWTTAFPHGVLPEAEAVRRLLLEVLTWHDEHALASGYMRLAPSSNEAQKERFIHRRGELKRRIWGVLFLDLRTVSLFRVQRQLGAMMAAGFAGAWALVAQFFLIRRAMQPQDVGDIVGLSGMLFLAFGTMAYIIKDRIKELGRSYFGGFLRHVPDHSERLFYKNRQGKPMEVGTMQETARFYAPKDLPLQIRALREEVGAGDRHIDAGVNRVLQYRKVITISRSLRLLNRYPLRAVHDILRLNIDACLPRLGEPSRFLDLVTQDGSVESVRFPKVYYLDMVLGYSKLDEKNKAEQQSLDYFRLVLDKKGLLRIERLS